jgi:hypothetical protein
VTAPRSGPCAAWATADDVDICGDRYADLDPYVLEDALDDATGLLWRKTGKRWPGVCSATVRPPCGTVWTGYNAPVWAQHDHFYLDGDYGVFCGCSCDRPFNRSCDCGGPSQITLGRSPIVSITEVLVDGDVLDPSGYRVDDWRYLVRLPDADGTPRSWPCTNNLSLATSEEGTWAVTFTYGRLPPGEGVRAAARLAGELALDRCGAECDLPPEVTRASREGIDFAFVTPSDDAWGAMPLPVKLFLDAVNPNNLTRGPKVWSPDLPGPNVRTNP